MEPMTLIVGLAMLALGAAIWRYKWIHLLSNVDSKQVKPGEESNLARFAGMFGLFVGVVLLVLSYFMEQATSERQLLLFILIAVAGIFVATGFYLAGLSRFLRK